MVHGGMQERLGAPTAPATMPSASFSTTFIVFFSDELFCLMQLKQNVTLDN